MTGSTPPGSSAGAGHGTPNSTRPLALVTGARRRVGQAIAIELARCGFDLLLTSRRDPSELDGTVLAAEEAAPGPIRVERAAVELDRPDSLGAFTARLSSLQHLDALVHNASSYGPSPLTEVSEGQLIGHYRVNAMAPLLITQAAWAALRRATIPGGASVVCFGDIHVSGRPRRDHIAYAMSKAALTHMVECLAREMAPSVRVNAIAPGVIAWPDDARDEERRAYEGRIPLGRAGTPDDAARMVRWLVTEAHYVTGTIIRLDGGRALR